MSQESDFASKLANDHLAWIAGYNKALGLTIIPLAAAEYLYRTAMFHGAGHGIETERNGTFRPRIGDTPLPAEEVAAISEGVEADCRYACDDCDYAKTCEFLYTEGRVVRCGSFLQAEPTPPSLCATCAKADKVCPIWGPNRIVDACVEYAAKVEALDLSLPSIVLECTEEDVWLKYLEELAEFRNEKPYSFAATVERWDCLHSLQTHKEKGGHSPETYATVAADLRDMHGAGLPVMNAKAACLTKNALRGYYPPETCDIIIASGGDRWQ